MFTQRMLAILVASFGCLFCVSYNSYSDIYLSDKLGAFLKPVFLTISAGRITPLKLPVLNSDTEVRVTLNSSLSTFDDVRVLVCKGDEKDKYLYNRDARCLDRSFNSTTRFSVTPKAGEQYWLVFDNLKSLFTSKAVAVEYYLLIDFEGEERQTLERSMKNILDSIFSYFEVEEFDLNIVSCETVNAFSVIADGDITMCSELIFDTLQKKIPLAFDAILMHELGHSLLNLWGSPYHTNETTADDFAAAVLFISANFPSINNLSYETVKPEEVIRSLIKYFESISNVSAEAQAAIMGDQHALSVQRINNLKSILVTPKPFVERWTTEIYPNLTILALESIIDNPHLGANLELANQLIQKKKACGPVALDKCTITLQ